MRPPVTPRRRSRPRGRTPGSWSSTTRPAPCSTAPSCSSCDPARRRPETGSTSASKTDRRTSRSAGTCRAGSVPSRGACVTSVRCCPTATPVCSCTRWAWRTGTRRTHAAPGAASRPGPPAEAPYAAASRTGASTSPGPTRRWSCSSPTARTAACWDGRRSGRPAATRRSPASSSQGRARSRLSCARW